MLTALVQRGNEFVAKASLLDAAWPHAVVEEGNLAMQISAIRRVLAEAGGARWIETLHRRGYRFVGPVKVIDDNSATSMSQRSNLPAALTSFIGREGELAELKRLLSTKRLLTIVGAGGIGKTRVALQAAAEVVDAYPDGVWLTELAPIRDPLLVAATVARALGIEERTRTPAIESLRGYLKSRQALL
ncbi:MAG TPA: winged helix-turn-helix domain-containing protein, partial [Candidatus Tumulicola sp.]|nr:winged helix-turn-helix domain-containing protein [Candidatus Tumulicola sp.]